MQAKWQPQNVGKKPWAFQQTQQGSLEEKDILLHKHWPTTRVLLGKEDFTLQTLPHHEVTASSWPKSFRLLNPVNFQ